MYFRRTSFIVTPMPSKRLPLFYRSVFNGVNGYGRTKSAAINRSYKRAKSQRS
jgi:hypothetical protein